MKTMRYIAIIIAILSILNVSAQNFAQLPEIKMHSTSGMVCSGSTLPSAAIEGTYVTGTMPGTYTPADIQGSGPRRIGGSGSGTGGNGAEETTDPFEDPLGDAAIPLALLALGYMAYLTYKTSKSRKRVRA